MVFEERKTGQEFEYKTEGVFGTMVFISPVQLDAEKLDAIFVAVLGAKAPKGIVGPVKFEFAMRPTWDDDDEEETEEDGPVETKSSLVTRIIEIWRRIKTKIKK